MLPHDVNKMSWRNTRNQVSGTTMRFLTALLTLVLLTGCDTVKSLADLQQKSEAVAEVLNKDLGTKPQVTANVVNGALTVNVLFESGAVSRFQVSDLELRVRRAVRQTYTDPPKQIVVSLRLSNSAP